MLKIFAAVISILFAIATSAPLVQRSDSVHGFDVSNHQNYTIDFSGAYTSGARFVIIKATEGSDYIDSWFSNHYIGATDAKFIRGGYHFARPDKSSGSQQATFFLAHGGGWTADGITLPGMIDMEGYPGEADPCYYLDPAAVVAWIQDFADTYHSKTGRYPMIYTNWGWWTRCTENSGAFSTTCPLALAAYPVIEAGQFPNWPYYTIWQYSDSYPYGGDADVFNGDLTQLQKLATG